MESQKIKEYLPWFSLVTTVVGLIITATWAISNLHTVNMVQDERLARLELNDSRYEDRFDRLDNKIDSGFARTYELITDIQSRKK